MPRKPAFISHSPQREAEIQSRMLDVLEASFRRKIATAIIDETNEILRGYEDLGYVPSPSDDAQARFREVYRQLALASSRTFGRRILTSGKAAGYDLETKQLDFAAIFASMANRWINQEPIRRRITNVTDTTREQIVTQVSRGQEDGLGQAAIAKGIRSKLPSISRWRSNTIARTETHGAANFSMQETAKLTGLELRKEWVAASGERTRDDHRRADGQVVAMDEPFIVGGERLMYPGDASGSAEQVINCRCAAVHSVVDLDD